MQVPQPISAHSSLPTSAQGHHAAQARVSGSGPTAALHAPSTMEARPAPPSFCINIDPAWEWGAPGAHRRPTVSLTRACRAPQTPEMFVEGWNHPGLQAGCPHLHWEK